MDMDMDFDGKCSICKNTGIVLKYDKKTGEPTEEDCEVCVRIYSQQSSNFGPY